MIDCPKKRKKQAKLNLSNSAIEVKIVRSVQELADHGWNDFMPKDQLFLSLPFLSAIEENMQDHFQLRYAMIFQEKELVAGAFFQMVNITGSSIKMQDEAQRRWYNLKANFRKLIKKTVNQIDIHLLVNGNAFITGENGFYYSGKISGQQAFEALSEAMEMIKAEEASIKKVDAIMIKDFHPHTIPYAITLSKLGYKEVEAQPTMILEFSRYWRTFEDYMNSMSSKYRLRVKKAQKKGAQIERRELGLDEIRDNEDLIYGLYQSVVNSAEFTIAQVRPGYFSTLKKHLPNEFKLYAYYLEDEMIGFICGFFNEHEQHIESHFIGYNKQYNKSHNIYQNVLCDLVKLGINNRYKTLAFGRTALEIKSTIGARGVPMNNFVWHRNPVSNRLLRPIFNQLKTEWVPRNPFKENPSQNLVAIEGRVE